MSIYKIQPLVESGFDFSTIFPEKQKTLQQFGGFNFGLQEIANLLKTQTENFSIKNEVALDIDKYIYEAYEKHLELTAPEEPKEEPKEEKKKTVEDFEKLIKGYSIKLKGAKTKEDKEWIGKKIKGYEIKIKSLKTKKEQGGVIHATGDLVTINGRKTKILSAYTDKAFGDKTVYKVTVPQYPDIKRSPMTTSIYTRDEATGELRKIQRSDYVMEQGGEMIIETQHTFGDPKENTDPKIDLSFSAQDPKKENGGGLDAIIKVRNIKNNKVSNWTIEELLERINEDNAPTSSNNYDKSDWVEGFNETLEGEFYSLNDKNGKPLNNLSKYADGGGMDDYTKTLGMVKVMFENPQYNYETNVSGGTTEDEARNYFVGKLLNVGVYPKENMQRVIDIQFHPKGSYQEEAIEVGEKVAQKVTKD